MDGLRLRSDVVWRELISCDSFERAPHALLSGADFRGYAERLNDLQRLD